MTEANQTMPELLPCPFCGGVPENVDATRVMGVYRVFHRCKVVGYMSIEQSKLKPAIEQWNTRSDIHTALQKSHAELLEALKKIANANPAFSKVEHIIEYAQNAIAAAAQRQGWA